MAILPALFESTPKGLSPEIVRRLPIAILKATPYNCIFDALWKFCVRILLRFLAIHQVLPRNRAAFGRKIYTQIILAELCGIALKETAVSPNHSPVLQGPETEEGRRFLRLLSLVYVCCFPSGGT